MAGLRCWRFISQAGVRADVVVVVSPLFQNDLRLFQRMEGFTVQAFIAQAAIEALVIAILPRAARFNIQGLYPKPWQPVLDRFRGKFRTVVRPDMIGNTARDKQVCQHIHHIIGFQAITCAQAQALPRIFIDHRQRSDLRAVF